MLDFNKIYNMDYLEGLKLMDDNSVDCIITDAPYGDNLVYGRNNKEIKNNETPLTNCAMLYNVQNIIKNDKTIYNFTNWKHYPFIVEFIEKYTFYNIRQLIVLNKSHFGLGYGFRNQHELIMVIEKGDPTYNLNDFSNVMEFKLINHDSNTHPHQKPLEVIRRLIKHSTSENDVVLDCFVGSGSIPLACKQLNRNYIGFEIDTKYYELALNRLAQETLIVYNLIGGAK